ncbi:D-alanyl-D-alanine carboxypeptidase [Rhodohalobacter mucosus]|uniref:D-alanyl-D-alanine carboxypeptidase n=1 Tax=Rhodohalobacter mucosus TaxID=2079485 RepID=A0A316TWW1_9BACT|nr:D-alanyl-D-alanine carboxypeptidase [Rhodohalobacter mucosus]PWN07745.1 D-alanyl-D-alanine carboxypeptidase [Rhodohalobacter mucosus]
MFPKLILLLCSLSILAMISCKSPESATLPDEPETSEPVERFFEESGVFSQSTTGFVLYDPEADSVLYDRDGDRYYTPASNMKIFTLYASLKALPDTLPSLRYTVRNDTLWFRGTGDPAFLNPNFETNGAYRFLKDRPETLVYFDGHYEDNHFGEGWPWDWYPAAYAPEKSPFPVYGNIMRLQAQQVALVMLNEEEPVKPAFFERYIENLGWDGEQMELVRRDYQTNTVFYSPRSDTARQERNIPFKYDSGLITEMLADTLNRPVDYTDRNDLRFEQTLHATPADTLYKRLMLESDNFVAEQLMLMISEMQSGTLNSSNAISWSLDNYFQDLPDRPQWRDGSGLTRYNLITPRSVVYLLEKLMDEYGEENVLSWFPAGGVSGTLRGYYRSPEGEPPFVYAKTGTLSNNTALSGYIYTNSGKRLSFSIIHNNYVIGNNTLRRETGRLLGLIRERY